MRSLFFVLLCGAVAGAQQYTIPGTVVNLAQQMDLGQQNWDQQVNVPVVIRNVLTRHVEIGNVEVPAMTVDAPAVQAVPCVTCDPAPVAQTCNTCEPMATSLNVPVDLELDVRVREKRRGCRLLQRLRNRDRGRRLGRRA